MENSRRYWKNRYQIIREIENFGTNPFSDVIEITQYFCEDQLIEQSAILKKIIINEEENLIDLTRFLWHYEISLSQKAIFNSDGKTLLKLIDAQYDPSDKCFILVTEYGGSSLYGYLNSQVDKEDLYSFQNFLGDKRTKWEAILNLIKGISALHNSGLIHRNISLETIYFDSEAYRQGQSEVLKLGDFNWSIYLYSIGNIFSNKYAFELVQKNLNFFRAPECLPHLESQELNACGENIQSDLFSIGLVLAFLLTNLKIQDYQDSEIKLRERLINNIRMKIQGPLPFLVEERKIILNLLEIDPQKRYPNAEKLIEDIENLLKKIKYNSLTSEELPIYFQRRSNSFLLTRFANKCLINIEATLRSPNDFLNYEFEDAEFYLSNNFQFPLCVRGRTSGLLYKIKQIRGNRNLAELYLVKESEKDFKKQYILICKANRLIWKNYNDDCSYSGWEQIFANSYDLMRNISDELSNEEKEKQKWIDALELVTTAETEIERRKIFPYQLLESPSTKDMENENEVKIVVSCVPNTESLSDVINESQSPFAELLDTINLFEPFKEKRKWRIVEVNDETLENTTITLRRPKKIDSIPPNGYIRMWDLKNTIPLLVRKNRIIQNLDKCDLLLNAILQPASSHKYFEYSEDRDMVSNIFNTYPIFLLQGPPGTGKTWTAKELIKLTIKNDPYARILVSSKEHYALDDLLIKTSKMLSELDVRPTPMLVRLISTEREATYSPDSIPFNHFNQKIAKDLLQKMKNWELKNSEFQDLSEEIKRIVDEEIDFPSIEWIDLVKECSNIIFSTTTAGELQQLEETRPHFDLVVIEEAGKAYPSELLYPLQLGNKWVLIGDQNQLPPFRLEEIYALLESELEKKEIEEKETPNYSYQNFLEFKNNVKKEVKIFQSVFERFQTVRHSYQEDDLIKSCDTLTDQYRLPSKISKMISSIFYDKEFNQKISDPDPDSFILEPTIIKDEQLVWLKTSYEREFRESRRGYDIYNSGEALLILNLLKKLKFSDDQNKSIVILTPYQEQVSELKRRLPNRLSNLKNINIRDNCYTIDSFQGQEADLVIISLVRSNKRENSRSAWGFIPKPERLNVMLSRAKKTEVIIGNLEMCLLFKKIRDNYMEKFIQVADFIQKYGKVVDYKEIK